MADKFALHREIGKRIMITRVSRDITMAEMEKRTGIDDGTISKYERGVLRHIDFIQRCKIADALHVSPLCYCTPEEVQAAIRVANEFAKKRVMAKGKEV